MPYLTPQELPEDDDCRPLSIPASTEWLALFGGALTELTKKYNWEDSGGLSVDETVEKMESIINNWYTLPCAACTTPGGYRTIRIGNSGRIEQLNGDGNWEDATDEYVIPPPAAREGGTEQDQVCLAAANAVNVYEQLYESLSESWSGEVDEAEAVFALIGVMVGVMGFAFAPIVYGIYAFFLPIFGVMFAALEYLTADLWDDDFSNTLECFLVNCGTNTGGVVTFDWQCFIDQLNSQTNPFSLTEEQIRLYLQVIYLLYFTGGVDGLNLAGGTTEITENDCSDCSEGWCRAEDFEISDYGWEIATEFSFVGDYTGGAWQSEPLVIGGDSWDMVGIKKEFSSPANFTEANISTDNTPGVHSGAMPTGIHLYLGGVFQDGIAVDPSLPGVDGLQWTGDVMADKILFYVFASNMAGTGTGKITAMTCRGDGENPFGSDNCI